MKINWCKYYIHNWLYSKDNKYERTCKRCGKVQIEEHGEYESGMGGDSHFVTVKPGKIKP